MKKYLCESESAPTLTYVYMYVHVHVHAYYVYTHIHIHIRVYVNETNQEPPKLSYGPSPAPRTLLALDSHLALSNSSQHSPNPKP